MKILFLIQGEGNGHLTQAISLYQMLADEGHQVVGALIGSASGNKKPTFFSEAVRCPITTYKTIGLAYTEKGRLSIRATLTRALTGVPDIVRSLRRIHQAVATYQPDLIINFYEVCGGLYKLLYPNHTPMHCIAHQYLFLHPEFSFPPKNKFHRYGLNFLTRVTALNSSAIYALSFSDAYRSTDTLTVVPPLLRRQVRTLTPKQGKHLLVYLTQPLLRRQIEQWHRRNPHVVIHCFCNNPLQKTKWVVDNTLTFHPTDTDTFLDLLQSCHALVTTAGFETACEAMFLGKPIMMVPVPNHYEQACNAWDATLSGIARAHHTFNLDYLLNHLPDEQSQNHRAREWFERVHELLLTPLTASTTATPAPTPAATT